MSLWHHVYAPLHCSWKVYTLPVSIASIIFYLTHSTASHPYLFTLTSSDQVLVKITSGFHFDRNDEEISVSICLGP